MDGAERERGITSTSARPPHPGRATTRISDSYIDTPGTWISQWRWSARCGSEGEVAILIAARGVQPQSENVWRQAAKITSRVLRSSNKRDSTGADSRTPSKPCAASGRSPGGHQCPIGQGRSVIGIMIPEEKEILARGNPGARNFEVSMSQNFGIRSF